MAGYTGPYVEGTNPASPTNFPNTGPGTPLVGLSPGASVVDGTLTSGGATSINFFELTGLGSGAFTAGATTTGFSNTISIFADTNLATALEKDLSLGSSAPASFGSLPIPGDGNLVVELTANESASSYAVTVTTTSTPEPATIATVSLGLAGALVLRRKRQQ